MLKKRGKYYADWRDATGARHRKAFDTAKEAADFAATMRADRDGETPRPNRSARLPHSPKQPRSGRGRSTTTRTPKPR